MEIDTQVEMAPLSELVGDLIRAANRVENLSEADRVRLLGRAYVTILRAREQIGDEAERYRQSSINLISATGLVRRLSEQDVKALLLDAAKMIRTIKIVLDAKHAE
ncbi:hypothetical protein OE766_14190 [Pararhizobium sp. YC-54]|uniref:hypothetical protein n=1 Tax=Pararhizobium sp. YC-54 TaxID=2986920 RepID=UPI0021F76799|nr:hypothetical protein [Pararhizobium sp. YC-54]MCV9999397.1 hypothetical protein [Pararhizobium sp. YC-54]